MKKVWIISIVLIAASILLWYLCDAKTDTFIEAVPTPTAITSKISMNAKGRFIDDKGCEIVFHG